MHLFIFIRGVQQFAELYKSHLQCQYWKWKRVNAKTKKEEYVLVQGALRQSYLGCYEYIFPEECLSEVIAVLGLVEKEAYSFKLNAIRKMMGLEKIPKKNFEEAKKIKTDITINGSMRGLSGINVAGTGCAVIGIKRDIRGEMYGFIQEAL